MKNFSKVAQDILMHRLDVPDCIADALDLDDDAEFAAAVEEAIRVVRGKAPIPASGLVRDILDDAADGTTFFGNIEDAVAAREITRGYALSAYKAAAEIEQILDVEMPRA